MNTNNSIVNDKRVMALMGLAIALGILIAWQFSPLQAQIESCAAGQSIEVSFSGGGGWDLCWSPAPAEGIVISQVYFSTPDGMRRQVLKKAGLAQLNKFALSGQTVGHYVSDPGLGENHLIELTVEDCPQGTLLQQEGRDLLCQQTLGRGFDQRYFTIQRQGQLLNLFSVSNLSGQLYVVQWRFYDNGIIEPMVGDTGVLLNGDMGSQADGLGAGYVTHAFWRLDLDIGDSATDNSVEEIEILPANNNSQRQLSVTPLTVESARSVNPDQKRTWRLRSTNLTNNDGHALSYQLEPLNMGHIYVDETNAPWTAHQFYVTVNNECERYVTQNPVSPGCGDNVTQFVDGEALAASDVVFWYGASAHRLIRDEDSPIKNIQWLSFVLTPRDWSAQNLFQE